MAKTELKITGISHARCIKTAAEVLTTLESIQHTKVKLRKVESLSLSFISGILIAFFTIVGCSDMPYTGSMMTTDTVDVNQYIVSPNEELVCLQNGHDSECLTLIPKNTQKVDGINGPIIHIHPERLVYVFYHEGKKIVQAEKVMDTTEIVETLTETKEDPSRQTGDLSGDIVVRDADDTQLSDPPPPPQNPPSGDTQQPITPPPPPPPSQTNNLPGGTGTVGDAPNANNNPDDTQQPITPPPPPQNPPSGGIQRRSQPPPPPPPPQIDAQSGDTADDDPNANNNPDNTQQPDPPSQRNNDPPSDNTPPPPPPQTTNQPRGNSNQNSGNSNQNAGGNSAPDPPPAPIHPKPNAMYYNDRGGWYVTIYYPENYTRARTQSDYGFSISSSNGITPVLQGSINSNSDNAQFFIKAGNGTLYVNVVWNTEPEHWTGEPPSERYLLQAGPRGSHRIMINIR